MSEFLQHITFGFAFLLTFTGGLTQPPDTHGARLITVTLNNEGVKSETRIIPSRVGTFLISRGIPVRPHDRVSPPLEATLYEGDEIIILRPTRVILTDGGEKKDVYTFAKTVQELLISQELTLGKEDVIAPSPETRVSENLAVRITRITKTEITNRTKIPYATQVKENKNVPYGKTYIIQEGSIGEKIQQVLVTKKDGKKIKEEVLGEKRVREPIVEIVEKGTKIEITRTDEGKASWYAFKGGMFAASTITRKGSFVRVTRLETGKSVIVRINDYGPDPSVHPDRVIDLDAVAFKALAPLGKGVITVRTEEISDK